MDAMPPDSKEGRDWRRWSEGAITARLTFEGRFLLILIFLVLYEALRRTPAKSASVVSIAWVPGRERPWLRFEIGVGPVTLKALRTWAYQIFVACWWCVIRVIVLEYVFGTAVGPSDGMRRLCIVWAE